MHPVGHTRLSFYFRSWSSLVRNNRGGKSNKAQIKRETSLLLLTGKIQSRHKIIWLLSMLIPAWNSWGLAPADRQSTLQNVKQLQGTFILNLWTKAVMFPRMKTAFPRGTTTSCCKDLDLASACICFGRKDRCNSFFIPFLLFFLHTAVFRMYSDNVMCLCGSVRLTTNITTVKQSKLCFSTVRTPRPHVSLQLTDLVALWQYFCGEP